MSKFVKFSMVLLIALTLVTGLLIGRDVLINVGWNTGIGAAPSLQPQVAACTYCGSASPGVQPYVGWNTGT